MDDGRVTVLLSQSLEDEALPPRGQSPCSSDQQPSECEPKTSGRHILDKPVAAKERRVILVTDSSISKCPLARGPPGSFEAVLEGKGRELLAILLNHRSCFR